MSFDGAPIEQFSKWWPKNFAIAHKTIHPARFPLQFFVTHPLRQSPICFFLPPPVFSSPQTAVGLTQTGAETSTALSCFLFALIVQISAAYKWEIITLSCFFFQCAFASSMRINLRSYFSNVFLSVCFFLYVCRQQAICAVCFLDWVSVVRNMGRRCRLDVYFENPFAINFQQKGF